MQKNFLFLEMSNLLKMCSRLVLSMMLILSSMRILWVTFIKILRTWVYVMTIVVWRCIVVIKKGKERVVSMGIIGIRSSSFPAVSQWALRIPPALPPSSLTTRQLLPSSSSPRPRSLMQAAMHSSPLRSLTIYNSPLKIWVKVSVLSIHQLSFVIMSLILFLLVVHPTRLQFLIILQVLRILLHIIYIVIIFL